MVLDIWVTSFFFNLFESLVWNSSAHNLIICHPVVLRANVVLTEAKSESFKERGSVVFLFQPGFETYSFFFLIGNTYWCGIFVDNSNAVLIIRYSTRLAIDKHVREVLRDATQTTLTAPRLS